MNIYYIELYRLWENILQYRLNENYIKNFMSTVVRMDFLKVD